MRAVLYNGVLVLCHVCSGDAQMKPSVVKAILTDVQFWVPVGVLALGVGLLAWLH